jgi:hypothetical protein
MAVQCSRRSKLANDLCRDAAYESGAEGADRMLLTHRQLLQSKAIAIDNDLRGTLRNFGLKVGMVGKVRFEARIKELVEKLPDLAVMVEPMLIVRGAARTDRHSASPPASHCPG